MGGCGLAALLGTRAWCCWCCLCSWPPAVVAPLASPSAALVAASELASGLALALPLPEQAPLAVSMLGSVSGAEVLVFVLVFVFVPFSCWPVAAAASDSIAEPAVWERGGRRGGRVTAVCVQLYGMR